MELKIFFEYFIKIIKFFLVDFTPNILKIIDILIYRNILCQYNLISALIIFMHQIKENPNNFLHFKIILIYRKKNRI